MKKVISLLMVVCVLAVALVGCGGGGIEGKWELAYLESDGQAMKMNGVTFEFKSGGKLVATMDMMGEIETAEGEWKADGGKYSVTIEGETQTFTLDGDKLIGEIMEAKAYFTKDLKNFKYPENIINLEDL